MRYLLRTAYLSWEFWIPPLLSIVAIACLIWLFSHNQDLLRQHQIDKATKVQVEQVTAKIQGLTDEVRDLKTAVKGNTRDIRENKAAIDADKP